jgi:hypothetical protein
VFNRRALEAPPAARLVERVTGKDRQAAVPATEQAAFEFSST